MYMYTQIDRIGGPMECVVYFCVSFYNMTCCFVNITSVLKLSVMRGVMQFAMDVVIYDLLIVDIKK